MKSVLHAAARRQIAAVLRMAVLLRLVTLVTVLGVDQSNRPGPNDTGEHPKVVVDGGRLAQLTLKLPAMAVTRIRAAASRSGLSLAAYISASIRCAQWNARHAGMLVWLEYDGARYQAQLPAPGLVTRCPCHPPVEASNATADGTGTLVPKITHQARAELRALARENPAGALTMTDYVEAATWVEQWNHDHRNCRVVVERDDGRYELLLPFAGIVSGRTAPVGERGH